MIHSISLHDYFKENGKKFSDTPLYEVLQTLNIYPCQDVYMAGGAVRKTVSGRDIFTGDIDFFFKNRAAYRKFYFRLKSSKGYRGLNMQPPFVKNFIMNTDPNSEPPGDPEPISFELEDLLSNKVVLPKYQTENRISIQLIHFRYFDSIQELMDRFDFTVCQFGITKDKFYYGERALGDNLFNKLHFNSTHNAHSIVYKRWDKYVCAGFKPTPEAIKKHQELVQWCKDNHGIQSALNDYSNV